jgi:hypothetical protein
MKYLMPVVLLLLFSCGNGENFPLTAVARRDSMLAVLDSCYNMKDTAWFNAFFERMTYMSPDAKPQTLLKAETYALFEEFYQPQRLSLLGSWIIGAEEINTGQPYLVLQEYLAVEVDGKPDTVRDFRPMLGPGEPPGRGSKIYWQPGFDSLLLHFLYNTHLNNLRRSRTWPVHVHPNEKISWLRNWIPGFGRDSSWNIVSSPEVLLISFNRSMNKAKVRFSAGYQTGEAFMRVENHRWRLISSQEIPNIRAN